jgi:hypothetical protein
MVEKLRDALQKSEANTAQLTEELAAEQQGKESAMNEAKNHREACESLVEEKEQLANTIKAKVKSDPCLQFIFSSALRRRR